MAAAPVEWPGPPPAAGTIGAKLRYFLDLYKIFSAAENLKNIEIEKFKTSFKIIPANIVAATNEANRIYLAQAARALRGPPAKSMSDLTAMVLEWNADAAANLPAAPCAVHIAHAKDIATRILNANKEIIESFGLSSRGQLTTDTSLIDPRPGQPVIKVTGSLGAGSNGKVMKAGEISKAELAAFSAARAINSTAPAPLLPSSQIVKQSIVGKNIYTLIIEWLISVIGKLLETCVTGNPNFDGRFRLFPEPNKILCDRDIRANDSAGNPRNPLVPALVADGVEGEQFFFRSERLPETVDKFLNRKASEDPTNTSNTVRAGILQILYCLARGFEQFSRIIFKIGDCYYTFDFVHGDMKEDNIMMDRDGFFRLIDFGMAQGRLNCWSTIEEARAHLGIREDEQIFIDLTAEPAAAPVAAAPVAPPQTVPAAAAAAAAAAAVAGAPALAPLISPDTVRIAGAAAATSSQGTWPMWGMQEYNDYLGRIPPKDIQHFITALFNARGASRLAGFDSFLNVQTRAGNVDLRTIGWFRVYRDAFLEYIRQAGVTLKGCISICAVQYASLPALASGSIRHGVNAAVNVLPASQSAMVSPGFAAHVSSLYPVDDDESGGGGGGGGASAAAAPPSILAAVVEDAAERAESSGGAAAGGAGGGGASSSSSSAAAAAAAAASSSSFGAANTSSAGGGGGGGGGGAASSSSSAAVDAAAAVAGSSSSSRATGIILFSPSSRRRPAAAAAAASSSSSVVPRRRGPTRAPRGVCRVSAGDDLFTPTNGGSSVCVNMNLFSNMQALARTTGAAVSYAWYFINDIFGMRIVSGLPSGTVARNVVDQQVISITADTTVSDLEAAVAPFLVDGHTPPHLVAPGRAAAAAAAAGGGGGSSSGAKRSGERGPPESDRRPRTLTYVEEEEGKEGGEGDEEEEGEEEEEGAGAPSSGGARRTRSQSKSHNKKHKQTRGHKKQQKKQTRSRSQRRKRTRKNRRS